jgi:pyruvate/2-oxoglutarate dehydrogenase complex dihydrolipoamide dehydrogenase (E3) component
MLLRLVTATQRFSTASQPILRRLQSALIIGRNPKACNQMSSRAQTTQSFDVLVIGSGQAGTPLASTFARAGRRTALIERTHIGGCCVNEGCTPTKTMVASGRAAYLARRGADYGVHTPGGVDGKIVVDMERVRQRKRDIVAQFRGGGEARTKAAGVEVLMGEASFEKAKTVRVKMNDGSEAVIAADLIFINTGERPRNPKIPGVEGADGVRVLDSTSIQELDEVPEHLIVLGGGYVGLEFAQLFRRLGAQVTVIQRGKQLLPREDPEIAECLLDILKEDGLTVHLEAIATHANCLPTSVELTCRSKDSTGLTISGSHLLLAAGRVPNTDMLNLSAAGVSTDSKGYVIVNELLETTAAGIYALGDVKGPPAFTHISYDDFRIIRTNLITAKGELQQQANTRNRIVPYVVYTDPQLGHVGLHEHEARKLLESQNSDRPVKIQVARMRMTSVARALETDETRGMMKAVVESETGRILGFSCLGIEGGEVMSVVQMAIMAGLSWRVLAEAVWAHPTLAESLNNLWAGLEEL